VDGTVSDVTFYANGTLLGKDTSRPYSFAWSSVPAGGYSLTAVARDNDGATTTSLAVAIKVSASSSTRVNVALAANGGIARASSVFGTGYPAAAVNNGDRRGLNFGSGGAWKDGTSAAFPDWVEVTFAAAKSISEVNVFSAQDNYTSPSEPTTTMTFTKYGLRSLVIEYWTGTAWQTLPGGTLLDNTLVWRRLTFTPVTTTKIRVRVNLGLGSYSRVTEIEAY
jgi:hypothetical protein